MSEFAILTSDRCILCCDGKAAGDWQLCICWREVDDVRGDGPAGGMSECSTPRPALDKHGHLLPVVPAEILHRCHLTPSQLMADATEFFLA